jgi:hypothetical protein
MLRGVAQSGSAPGLGPGGRRFESSLPDHVFNDLQTPHINYFGDQIELIKSSRGKLSFVCIQPFNSDPSDGL